MNKILLSILTLLFLSCSSDNSNQEIDPIIGVWKPIKKVVPNSSFDTIYFNECERKSRYQFSDDGNISQWNIYSLNSSNECYTDTQLISGSWVRTNNPSDSENTFFELNLLNTLNDSTYVANDHYDVGFFENHNNLIWRTFSITGSSGYLFLERVE